MKIEKEIIETAFEEEEFSVFDFETTGVSARSDKVIEIGIVRLKKGKIVDTFSSFINPGRPIPFFITNLTGITNADVEGAPFFDELFPKIKEFIEGSVLVAHNLSFDLNFLKNECLNAELEVPQNDAICTLKIARKIYPGLASKSLGGLVKHLKIRHRDVHRGLGDATATAKILLRMFKDLRADHNIDSIRDLITFQSSPSSSAPFKMIKKKLADDLVKVPQNPGIYIFKNAKGEVIYIGKAKCLKDRVKNHFMSNAIKKSKKIVQAASSVEFKITNSELTALIAETEMIKIHKPRFNTMLKNFPVSYFVKVAGSKPYPTIEPSTKFDFDGDDYYGPYPNRVTVNSTKEIVDKTFQLRECTDKEFAKKRKCYLSDIKRCLTPCIEDIKEEYNEELSRVHQFLSGQNQSAVDRLLNKMKELSAEKKYEEAAEIRDVVQSILSQLHRSSILSEPINRANTLIEIESTPKNDYLLLLEGKIFFSNFFMDKNNDFITAIEDYYGMTFHLDISLSDKDLERLKISLSWLANNRNRIKVHYLKEYNTFEELQMHLKFPVK